MIDAVLVRYMDAACINHACIVYNNINVEGSGISNFLVIVILHEAHSYFEYIHVHGA